MNINYSPFSVSMCVYWKDNPEWFDMAIESILNQTVKPSEVVLVIDGYITQELESVITKYSGFDFFKIIRFRENKGHGIARNTGLKNCSFDKVALMDSDDISLPNRFEKELELFRANPFLSIVGSQISEFIDDPLKPVSFRVVPISDEAIKKYMKNRCPLNQPSVMFKKKDIMSVGGYIDWFCNEDYFLWIRLALAGKKFENSEEVLVNMRISADSYQRRGGLRYFTSECKLQNYMLKKRIISHPLFCVNIIKRFILQILLPNKMREWVFRYFARS